MALEALVREEALLQGGNSKTSKSRAPGIDCS